MAVQQIPNLPAAIALNGTEQLEAVQAGSSVRVTSAQIALLASPYAGNPLLPALGGTGTGTIFTTGSVVFSGASGVYQQNNSKFFWDNTNFRLGIGTATPAYNLDVSGTASVSSALTIGVQQTTQGSLVLANTAAGAFPTTINANNSASAAWTLTLPATGGTNNYALTTNGSGVTSWSQISLTAGVTGVLPVANGGTNASAPGITAFNNITGYTAAGATGTTSTNIVFSTAPTLTGLVLAAGTASVAPVTLTSGTNLTTAAAGAIEYDGKLSYFTPASTARALTPSIYYYRNNSAVTLASATGNQSILGTTSGVTLQASTIYEVEGNFELTTTGTTSHTESIGFVLTTATVTAMGVEVDRLTVSTTATGTTGAYLTTVTPVATTGAITTAQTVAYVLRGSIAIGTGGRVNPVIAFSAGPGGTSTVVAGAWFKFIPIGTTGSNVSIGTWA